MNFFGTFPTQTEIRRILSHRGLQPLRSLGQNFLIDEGMAGKIVAALKPCAGDKVLEIGPGLGALTGFVAPQVEKVVAVDIDRGLSEYLTQIWDHQKGRHVQVVHQDILKWSLESVWPEGSFKLLGNLPYSITGPLLMQMLEWRQRLSCAVVMVQEEVAEKLFATVGHSEYNRISVYFQAVSQVERVARVPRQCFYPQPKVDSAVMRIVFQPELPHGADWAVFQNIVQRAFQQRRKTLLNALSKDETPWADLLSQMGLSARVRAQELSADDFCRLAKSIKEL